ncbi:helix-turn-helix transcriptional regulator [Nocardia otitidiscaviarum]|uniref:Helix-turn-helix transcriptional regulator n=1 Tax=Nocardia otitidiscaviarum TaxID=1823 RepID=A0A516NPC6_9NOCA|nr:helix-turn-helix transcriptional regulator [Nocardia otitidiscaviarum]MCP9623968.1 helix-turn-helix transcriptional regulator [Nocardia otitidiscaviarum]QDP80756.1 helix-turn-helix transcriptional regulator [Nocardia otitidiscaviarum]
MTGSLEQAKEALGARLRELRQDAGITGTELARRAGWHQTKVSKIEYGKTKPADEDIRVWCAHTGSEAQIPDLIATLRNIEAAWVEWRRVLGTGTKRRQQVSIRLEAETEILRVFHPFLVPGLLQTAEYAEAVLRSVVEFQQTPDDIDEGVSKRMERQQILYRRNHRFHFVIAEQALHTTVGTDQTMIGQLDRLSAVLGMPRVALGIIPAESPYRVSMTNFAMFDQARVMIETVTAELTVTQPREIAQYGRAFDVLAGQAVTGPAARALIRRALATRTGRGKPRSPE